MFLTFKPMTSTYCSRGGCTVSLCAIRSVRESAINWFMFTVLWCVFVLLHKTFNTHTHMSTQGPEHKLAITGRLMAESDPSQTPWAERRGLERFTSTWRATDTRGRYRVSRLCHRGPFLHPHRHAHTKTVILATATKQFNGVYIISSHANILQLNCVKTEALSGHFRCLL